MLQLKEDLLVGIKRGGKKEASKKERSLVWKFDLPYIHGIDNNEDETTTDSKADEAEMRR